MTFVCSRAFVSDARYEHEHVRLNKGKSSLLVVIKQIITATLLLRWKLQNSTLSIK